MQHMRSLCNTFHVGSLYKNQTSNKGMKRRGENVSSSLAGLMNCWGHIGSLYKNKTSNKGMKGKGENVSSSLAGLMNCWGTHSTHMTDQKRTPKGPSGLSSLANSAMHTHTTTLQGPM